MSSDTNGNEVAFQGDENILELDIGDGCKTLGIQKKKKPTKLYISNR